MLARDPEPIRYPKSHGATTPPAAVPTEKNSVIASARISSGNIVKAREDQRIGEKHGVVKKRLRNHEQQSQNRPARVRRQHGSGHHAKAKALARMNSQRLAEDRLQFLAA